MSENKCWPENCVWAEPLWNGEGEYVDTAPEELMLLDLDDEGDELIEIREYMNSLVESGRLFPDYSLNDEYEGGEDDEDWEPEKGQDFWDDGFDLEGWEDAVSHCVNLLKIPVYDADTDPVSAVRRVINYSFINENLLRQAFTRRAFQIEHGLKGCGEELEFFGDTVLNTVVTREIYKRFSEISVSDVDAPFVTRFDEGELSKMRAHFVSKEHLSERAKELELDLYILYGTGEDETDSSREDMIEALIGAVAVDSGWNWTVLEDVVDRLVNIQLNDPDCLLKQSYFDMLNSWHQKHFGTIPEYEVIKNRQPNGEYLYDCSVRFFVPDNDKDINTAQRIYVVELPHRSAAREFAAQKAVDFIQNNGLWVNLRTANLEPRFEDAINQLQELKQKKYVEAPEYSFEEDRGEWRCDCKCSGVIGYGKALNKTKAKKKAAYMVLVRLLMSAGICKEEWESTMWKMIQTND